MKRTIGKFVVFAIGALAIGVPVSHAQIMNQIDFKTSQPFTVANTTLAAGAYIIRPVPGADQTVLDISSASGKPSVMVEVEMIQPDAAQSGSHLVFNQYKNILTLSQVFPSAGNQGYQLIQGHLEKQAAKTEKPTKQTVASTAK
jgi:hypothetical protein